VLILVIYISVPLTCVSQDGPLATECVLVPCDDLFVTVNHVDALPVEHYYYGIIFSNVRWLSRASSRASFLTLAFFSPSDVIRGMTFFIFFGRTCKSRNDDVSLDVPKKEKESGKERQLPGPEETLFLLSFVVVDYLQLFHSATLPLCHSASRLTGTFALANTNSK
jgi:hypothetical protein